MPRSKVYVITRKHVFTNLDQPISNQGYTNASVVLPGVTVGRGSIVGANAVVTKDVEPYTIVGGVPARLIKKRTSEKD